MKKIDEYMHIKEAASFVGVTPNTLRNWEREQKLRTYRNPLNHYRLYDKTDLELLLKNIKTRSL
jgi:DNA (cytosine-5)-methyltransferase 1